jgi:hypothetical protein
MKFFAVQNQDLESERFLAASNDQIATWVFAHGLCSKQCNGGVIANAAGLPERFWNRHGIDKAMLLAPSPLWDWVGEDLHLEFYDIDGQTIYQKKVEGGRKGGRNRQPSNTPERSLNSSPNRTPNTPDPTRPDPTQPEELSLIGASSDTAAEKPKDHETDALWDASLKPPRVRTSKKKVRQAWERIPKHERPSIETAVAALKAWNRCPEWRKDDNQFVPGLHRWIADRQWENLPESGNQDPLARYKTQAKPPPPPPTEADRRALAEVFEKGLLKANLG